MKGSPAKLGTIEGTSAFKDRKIKKAKKLVKRNVGNTTVDSPNYNESKHDKSVRKITKAIEILRGKGYSEEEIEQMTGAAGYKTAMDWAMSKD